MAPVLEVNDAHKSYGATQALAGARLVLERGGWMGLLGPNGAGKTTLIRAIAGRVRLDRGSVTLLGERLNGNAAAAAGVRARLGIVPQEIALYPLLTAEENLEAFGGLHGVRKSDLAERVKWALEWTGLLDRARALVKTFSGGMKRRLNIACGVLHRPEVVLLDEPTVGVDPQSRQRIWEMLDQLRADGASLLLTTHQLDEAQHVCERITIIDHGKAIAAGTLDELIAGTIGSERRVTLTLKEALPVGALADSIDHDGAVLRCGIGDVASDLSDLLSRVRTAGGTIADIHVESPSLHAVFIHLTGRELRE